MRKSSDSHRKSSFATSRPLLRVVLYAGGLLAAAGVGRVMGGAPEVPPPGAPSAPDTAPRVVETTREMRQKYLEQLARTRVEAMNQADSCELPGEAEILDRATAIIAEKRERLGKEILENFCITDPIDRKAVLTEASHGYVEEPTLAYRISKKGKETYALNLYHDNLSKHPTWVVLRSRPGCKLPEPERERTMSPKDIKESDQAMARFSAADLMAKAQQAGMNAESAKNEIEAIDAAMKHLAANPVGSQSKAIACQAFALLRKDTFAEDDDSDEDSDAGKGAAAEEYREQIILLMMGLFSKAKVNDKEDCVKMVFGAYLNMIQKPGCQD